MLTGKRQNSARKARQATFRTLDRGRGSVSLKAEERKACVREDGGVKGPSLATRLIHGATPPAYRRHVWV